MARLKTETNTLAMSNRIKRAFVGWRASAASISVDFEHGQWWVTVLGTGAQYSVIDAEGGSSVDGFDFEQVSQGRY